MIVVKNPFSGKILGEYPFATRIDISAALEKAMRVFETWKETSSYERSELLSRVANVVTGRRNEFVELLRDEAGKPIRFAEIEVGRAITVLRWAAAEVHRFSGELVRTNAEIFGRPGFGIHTRFPRGPVLGILPFNWPLLTAAHKVAPAIAVGSPILIKPRSSRR